MWGSLFGICFHYATVAQAVKNFEMFGIEVIATTAWIHLLSKQVFSIFKPMFARLLEFLWHKLCGLVWFDFCFYSSTHRNGYRRAWDSLTRSLSAAIDVATQLQHHC